MNRYGLQARPIVELSSENSISGRRKIKVVLHEIHPDPEHYQGNGISWNETYTKDNLESVAGMSIVVEFLTDDRDIPYGHGMTGVKDNLPIFENATVVGHFDRGYVGDMEIEGENRRVLIAEGTLDEMRYPNFIEWLNTSMEEGTVKGSVEIVGKKANENRIVYEDGWKEVGRVPQIYDYSGYAILGVQPADDSAVVVELNQKRKEGEENMDEKMKQEITAMIGEAVTEINSKWDEFWARVDQLEAEKSSLQADIAQKDADIARLSADFDKAQADLAAANAGLTEANALNETMKAEKAEADEKAKAAADEKAVCELNAALEGYTQEQQDFAREEIEAFKAAPGSVEINSIVGKICTEMVRLSREGGADTVDVFRMNDHDSGEDHGDGNEVNVF